ncbi:AAA family ATPase [Rhizobium deserti]|uniref:AAA family ATPase n=1 Tax=Rhizobium deserti TaxID=2547961 RepID=A0A4R5UKW0_9HYPH|nr:AAA family ATPase [Rhizobium deserti]
MDARDSLTPVLDDSPKIRKVILSPPGFSQDCTVTYKTIYLTGAPAAGKTTAVNLLSQKSPSTLVWSYSERLQQHLANRATNVSQQIMRSQSSLMITPDDILAVDRQLLSFVEEHRGASDLIIDSHPVTKESYGYRVTAFSLDQIMALKPDEIWMLFASPSQTVERIGTDAQGRPAPSLDEALLHTSIQASVATAYGILTGRPVYFFDSNVDAGAQAERMAKRLG